MTNYHSEVTAETVKEHGLNDEEYALALEIMGRAPNLLELGIFSVMWSEHCSYKSSKKWLKTLPTEGPQVIQGPGENAATSAVPMRWPDTLSTSSTRPVIQ